LIIHEWAVNSKGHGIANIARVDNWFLRLIWISAFLSCVGYCIYQIALVVEVYLKYEVTTKYSLVNEAPMLFPAVSICNLNPYDGLKINTAIDDELAQRHLSVSNYTLVSDFLDQVTNQFKSSFHAQAANGTFNLQYSGYDLTEMLVSCKFAGVECTLADFSYFYDYDYGNCYRFNGGTNATNQTVL
jgi:hypothetical protein